MPDEDAAAEVVDRGPSPEVLDDVLGRAVASAVRRAMVGMEPAPLGELGRRGPDDGEDVDGREPVPPPAGVDDPYEILGVAPGAPWERIAAAHRRLARAWHPDGADPRDPVAVADREDLIRRLNAAFAELRVRRNR